MGLAEQIKSDVATAMKAGDRDRVGALRLVLSELQKAAKDGDTDEQAVLRRERKRRRESETAYRDAGRPELAAAEAYEAGVIDAYLPAELGDAELDALIARAMSKNLDARPANAAALASDLRAIVTLLDARAGDRAQGTLIPLEEDRGHGPMWIGAVTVAAAAGLVWWWLR